MKKTIAIALLVLFLFNLGGYMLLFQYFIYRSDSSINDHIGSGMYKASELVEIKIPVQLPSVCNWDDYEPISGQVQLSGNCYNYVKLKVTRDTMFLMCIPNFEKTRLLNENVIYAKQVSDSPLSKKSSGTSLKLPNTYSKYNHQVMLYQFTHPFSWIQKIHTHYLFSVDNPIAAVNGQPPEALV